MAAETVAEGNYLYNTVSSNFEWNFLAPELNYCTIYKTLENNGHNMDMHESYMYSDESNNRYITGISSDQIHSGALEVAACANALDSDIPQVYTEDNPNIRPYSNRIFQFYFRNIYLCIVDRRSNNGILDYFGNREDKLCFVQNISDFSQANGDGIFASNSDGFPVNTKPSSSRMLLFTQHFTWRCS